MLKISAKKAQNTAEYAILITLVVAAAIAMQTYVKRTLQGSIKFTVDKAKSSSEATGQYEPYYLESSYNRQTSAYKDTEETKAGGEVVRKYGEEAEEGKKKTLTSTGYQKYKDTATAD